MQNSENKPKEFYFQKGIFIWAYILGHLYSNVRIFRFENWEKMYSMSYELIFSQVVLIARNKSYEFILFMKR